MAKAEAISRVMGRHVSGKVREPNPARDPSLLWGDWPGGVPSSNANGSERSALEHKRT